MTAGYDVYELGNVALQSGMTLQGARIAYKTFGKLNAAGDNAIVYPTWYSGKIAQNEWLIGADKGLNPEKYFIIIPALFGNGESSSPSNTPAPQNGSRFPDVTFADNVLCQHRLVTEHLKVKHLRMVLGWSMGACQSYQWGVQYPDMMDTLLPFCGSTKTSPYNKLFLEAVMGGIRTDAAWQGGWYKEQPAKGLRATARVYAGWGFSDPYYWDEEWRKIGFTSLEDFLVRFWEGYFLDGRDANDLLVEAWTWFHGDVGQTPGFAGDTKRALQSIKAKVIQMPGSMDRYFPVKDEEYASQWIKHTEVRPVPSTWGHFAGFGANAPDTAFIDKAVRELLGS